MTDDDRRFDLVLRRLLAGDLTEAEAVELDEINARLSATMVRPTPELPEVTAAVTEAKTLIEARR